MPSPTVNDGNGFAARLRRIHTYIPVNFGARSTRARAPLLGTETCSCSTVNDKNGAGDEAGVVTDQK